MIIPLMPFTETLNTFSPLALDNRNTSFKGSVAVAPMAVADVAMAAAADVHPRRGSGPLTVHTGTPRRVLISLVSTELCLIVAD